MAHAGLQEIAECGDRRALVGPVGRDPDAIAVPHARADEGQHSPRVQRRAVAIQILERNTRLERLESGLGAAGRPRVESVSVTKDDIPGVHLRDSEVAVAGAAGSGIQWPPATDACAMRRAPLVP